jgi:hypothetical protein
MSLADIWDRFFWSVMIALFVGLVWLKYLDPVVACVGPGLVVAAITGGIYFYLGWRRATRAAQAGETMEEGGS